MTPTRDQLHSNCLAIARLLESEADNAVIDFFDDALSIEYTIDGQHNFLGAEILVAFGGPTIWVKTRTDTIEGSWGDVTVNMRFHDAQNLHGMCEDFYAASAGH